MVTGVRAFPWKHFEYAVGQRLAAVPIATYGTKAGRINVRQGRKRTVILTAAGGSLAAGTVLAFSDSAQHAYTAVQRTGRVMTTLALCMNEWVLH